MGTVKLSRMSTKWRISVFLRLSYGSVRACHRAPKPLEKISDAFIRSHVGSLCPLCTRRSKPPNRVGCCRYLNGWHPYIEKLNLFATRKQHSLTYPLIHRHSVEINCKVRQDSTVMDPTSGHREAKGSYRHRSEAKRKRFEWKARI